MLINIFQYMRPFVLGCELGEETACHLIWLVLVLITPESLHENGLPMTSRVRKILLSFEQTVVFSFKPEGNFYYFHTIPKKDATGKRHLILLSKAMVDLSLQGRVVDAREVFDRMTFHDPMAWNLMIKCYVQNGKTEEARLFFDEMQCKDTVSWNTMIMAYTREQRVHLAFKLFVAMPSKHKDIISWTTMIKGLAQMSQIDDSWRLFNQLPMEPNSIAWASIISGFQQSGLVFEALTLFKMMLFAGKEPTPHSFTTALTASAALSSLTGQQIYCQVVKRGFQNTIRVMNAAVSMFIKLGNLGNARIVFDEMPERDVVTWNSMIVGYGQHGLGSESIALFRQMQNAGCEPDRISFLGLLHACSHCGSVEEAQNCFTGMERDFGVTPSVEHYACMVDVFSRAGMLQEAINAVHQMPFEPTSVFWKSILNGCRIHRDVGVGLYAAERALELEPNNASVGLLVTELCEEEALIGSSEVDKVRKNLIEKIEVMRKELGCSWVEIKGKTHLFTARDETHLESDYIYEMLKLLENDVLEQK